MTSKEKEDWEIEIEVNPETIRVPKPAEKPATEPMPEKVG